MAPAIPLIAAAAGSAVASAIGTGILASLAGALVSTAIGQLGSRALAKKPKAQAFTQEAQGRAIVVRSSIETHKLIYGRARASGPMVYAATAYNGAAVATVPKDNKMLHLVIPLAGHEVEEITTIYLNEIPVSLHSDGFVLTAPFLSPPQSGFSNANVLGQCSYVLAHKHLGTDDQAADTTMLSELQDWTADHRLQGIAYIYLRMEYNQDVFPLGIPNASARVNSTVRVN